MKDSLLDIQTIPKSYGNFKNSPEKGGPAEAGGDVDFYDFREDDHEYFTQPGKLFRGMSEEEPLVLFENTARNMEDAPLQIKHRHINYCYQTDPAYGEGVVKALNIDIETVNLEPMLHNSREQDEKYNARGYRVLNVPTEPANPASAKDLPAEDHDTNRKDLKELTSWENNNHVL